MDFTRADLEKIVLEQFNLTKMTPLLNTQIGKFITERGYSYKEIAQALVFFVEVDKGEIDVKFGLGIVPHVMDRAKAFFEQKRREKQKQLESLKNVNNEIDIILQPQKLKNKRTIKKINLEELED